jgi:hypothetical protein
MILLPSPMYRRLQELFPTCRSPQEGRPLQIPMAVVPRESPGQPPPAGRPPQLRPSRPIWPWARYRPPGTESSTFGWECLWQARFSVSHSSHKGEATPRRDPPPRLPTWAYEFLQATQCVIIILAYPGTLLQVPKIVAAEPLPWPSARSGPRIQQAWKDGNALLPICSHIARATATSLSGYGHLPNHLQNGGPQGHLARAGNHWNALCISAEMCSRCPCISLGGIVQHRSQAKSVRRPETPCIVPPVKLSEPQHGRLGK